MDVNSRPRYPYARVKALNEFMTFARTPGWKPAHVDADLLHKLDIARGKEREALNALRFLGIISEDGVPTEAFDKLKQDYVATLRTLVHVKYKELIDLIPPTLANQSRLVRFFGLSADTSEYQAKLFSWLCEEAGIALPNLEKHFHRSRHDKVALKRRE